MDIKELKKLVEILKETEVTEFEMEREGVKIKLSRGQLVNMETPTVNMDFARQVIPTGIEVSAPQVLANNNIQEPVPVAAPEQKKDDILSQDGIHIVNSPIVGTFYRKPNPNADPFVDIGSKVTEGQILCIVEAMKLMNEITTEVGGEVVKIFIEDAQPVEYGEPLFAIKTK